MLRLIELLVVLYCFLGMFSGVSILLYAGAAISIAVQLLAIIRMLGVSHRKIIRLPLITYVISMAIILVLTVVFAFMGAPLGELLNRSLTLLSVFGLTIIFCLPEIRLNVIIEKVLKCFALLAVIIGIDAFLYVLTGFSLWPPAIYITERFAGPFFDSNFLSITYAFLLIIVLFGSEVSGRLKKMMAILFLTMLILGGSWSAISLLLIACITGFILKTYSFGKKQLIIITVYCFAVILLSANMSQLAVRFEGVSSIFGIGSLESAAKFESFEQRVLTQRAALEGVVQKPIGHAPQSIVRDLGRDTHNSYIGIAYELGLLGIMLVLINISYKRKILYNRADDILTTFFFLIALTINLHYSSIFLILLLYLHRSRKPLANINQSRVD